MERIDGRKLPNNVIEEKRKLVIALKKKGIPSTEIVEFVSLSIAAVNRIWLRYRTIGKDSLKTKRKGREFGSERHLNMKQEKEIQTAIIDKCPDQIKLPFALWTRSAVQQLIEQEYGFRMPIRTVGEYLKRWGFTPQKPNKFAIERKPEVIKSWLENEYPAIRVRSTTEDAEIYWGDETGLQTGDVRGRSYAPRGERPTVHATAKRGSISMISAISNRGKVHWMVTDGSFDSEKFIEFLTKLIKDIPRKIFLIVDNLRAHHSKVVTAWVNDHKDKIELFFLPPYCPDLNPDERLNSDLKYGIGSQVPVKTVVNLKERTETHMNNLQNKPEKVCSFFQDQAVKYAAF
jgi:transposase